MTDETTAPRINLTRPLTLRQRLWRRAVLGALAPMKQGKMTIHLPGGEAVVIGAGSLPAQQGFDGTAAIRVLHEKFFRRCALYGDIGFAESYMEGEWTTEDIGAVISWFILNAESSPAQSASRSGSKSVDWLSALNRLMHLFRSNSRKGSRRNISAHYDLSNDFFELFLDRSMTYSSAYFSRPDQTLEEAQTQKYDLLCRKLRLGPDDRVLEIGGGWGAFSRYAAKNYGCHVTSITISRQQLKWAAEKLKEEGLEERVELRLCDYRDLSGRFDKIVSIEMLEAVGHEYLETYFAKCEELLTPRGLIGLQYITCADSRYDKLRRGVDFIQKHIFPGALILSVSAVDRAVHRTGDLVLHHLEDLGHSYTRTLDEWHARFNRNLDRVRDLGFDEMHIRKWNYYLMYCRAAFAMRHNSVVQAVYTRPNNLSL